MYTIRIENECECFKKSELENNINFSSQTSAVMRAMKIVAQMNNSFCQKHNFILKESDDSFLITLNPAKNVVNCCGNGCCG